MSTHQNWQNDHTSGFPMSTPMGSQTSAIAVAADYIMLPQASSGKKVSVACVPTPPESTNSLSNHYEDLGNLGNEKVPPVAEVASAPPVAEVASAGLPVAEVTYLDDPARQAAPVVAQQAAPVVAQQLPARVNC